MGVRQTGFLPLFLHHELHQVLRAHEARGFGVCAVDHVDFLPMGQQVVEMFNFLSCQVSRSGLVALLYEWDVTRRAGCEEIFEKISILI